MKKPNKDKKQEEILKQELQEYVSYKLYEMIAELNDGLIDKVSLRDRNDILVNALSVNLGHVIGQFDPANQRKYAALAKQAIKEYMLLGSIEKERYVYGVVGRA